MKILEEIWKSLKKSENPRINLEILVEIWKISKKYWKTPKNILYNKNNFFKWECYARLFGSIFILNNEITLRQNLDILKWIYKMWNQQIKIVLFFVVFFWNEMIVQRTSWKSEHARYSYGSNAFLLCSFSHGNNMRINSRRYDMI